MMDNLSGRGPPAPHEMRRAAWEIRNRSESTLKVGEMVDYPVYADGGWEIQFTVSVPDRLAARVRDLDWGVIHEVSFGLYWFFISGMPMIVALLRLNNDSSLSYGTLARVDMLGRPGSTLQGLNYFRILGAQSEISCRIRGDGTEYVWKLPNRLLHAPQIDELRNKVSLCLNSPEKYDAYQYQRASLMAEWTLEGTLSAHRRVGVAVEELLGRMLWARYEAGVGGQNRNMERIPGKENAGNGG